MTYEACYNIIAKHTSNMISQRILQGTMYIATSQQNSLHHSTRLNNSSSSTLTSCLRVEVLSGACLLAVTVLVTLCVVWGKGSGAPNAVKSVVVRSLSSKQELKLLEPANWKQASIKRLLTPALFSYLTYWILMYLENLLLLFSLFALVH